MGVKGRVDVHPELVQWCADVNRVWPTYRSANGILEIFDMPNLSILDHYIQYPDAEKREERLE